LSTPVLTVEPRSPSRSQGKSITKNYAKRKLNPSVTSPKSPRTFFLLKTMIDVSKRNYDLKSRCSVKTHPHSLALRSKPEKNNAFTLVLILVSNLVFHVPGKPTEETRGERAAGIGGGCQQTRIALSRHNIKMS